VYNYLICLVARLLQYETILHHHTAAHTKANERRFSMLLWLLGSNCIHICLSEQMRSDLVRLYKVNPNNVLSLNNAGLIRQVPAMPRSAPRSPPTVGIISNNSIEKGLDLFLETVECAISRNVQLQGIVVGPISSDVRLPTPAFDNPVELRGPVPNDRIRHSLADIDFFIFPSRYRYEAQPLVLLEALSAGVPVIATSAGYISEMLDGGGVICPLDGFPSHATAVIGQVLEQPGGYQAASARAVSRYMALQHRGHSELAEFRRRVLNLLGVVP
jgi:glycosyltransferase involved in cell wall biosynthesis